MIESLLVELYALPLDHPNEQKLDAGPPTPDDVADGLLVVADTDRRRPTGSVATIDEQ